MFTLPHHSFASDEYLLGAGLLKNSVMDGAADTPAAEVARLLQQVCMCACLSVARTSTRGEARLDAFPIEYKWASLTPASCCCCCRPGRPGR